MKPMKISTATKLDRATNDEETRYAIDRVMYHAQTNTLRATDGRIVAVVPPLSGSLDKDVLIPRLAFEIARRPEPFCDEDEFGEVVDEGERIPPAFPVALDQNGHLILDVQPETWFPDSVVGTAEAKFPKFPPIDDKIVPPQDEDDIVVGLNVALLKRLSEALGSDRLILRINRGEDRLTGDNDKTNYDRAIRVEVMDGDAYGAIMPIKVTS